MTNYSSTDVIFSFVLKQAGNYTENSHDPENLSFKYTPKTQENDPYKPSTLFVSTLNEQEKGALLLDFEIYPSNNENYLSNIADIIFQFETVDSSQECIFQLPYGVYPDEYIPHTLSIDLDDKMLGLIQFPVSVRLKSLAKDLPSQVKNLKMIWQKAPTLTQTSDPTYVTHQLPMTVSIEDSFNYLDGKYVETIQDAGFNITELYSKDLSFDPIELIQIALNTANYMIESATIDMQGVSCKISNIEAQLQKHLPTALVYKLSEQESEFRVYSSETSLNVSVVELFKAIIDINEIKKEALKDKDDLVAFAKTNEPNLDNLYAKFKELYSVV